MAISGNGTTAVVLVHQLISLAGPALCGGCGGPYFRSSADRTPTAEGVDGPWHKLLFHEWPAPPPSDAKSKYSTPAA